MFCVYAIYNRELDKIYIGQTVDLVQRLKYHNGELKSKSKSFTYKNKGDWQLIYKEEVLTRKDAMMREKQLKSCQGRVFIRGKIS
ncbi:MAG TPA: GIY-YIG nuclease family protein [Candidatus Paceibacterota bacterium]|nr:GIY-YIG nuclease family protein [Candidatus Paceibacterota bacterium]HPT40429.1 GIY-YIG nuclease family protein [Candidatus Paceibacterota bacterium]